MTTQSDAREAILKNIIAEADGATAENLRLLAEAYSHVKKPNTPRGQYDD